MVWYKGSLISESFFTLAQITPLSTIHQKRRCSGKRFGCFFEPNWKTFWDSVTFSRLLHIKSDGSVHIYLFFFSAQILLNLRMQSNVWRICHVVIWQKKHFLSCFSNSWKINCSQYLFVDGAVKEFKAALIVEIELRK